MKPHYSRCASEGYNGGKLRSPKTASRSRRDCLLGKQIKSRLPLSFQSADISQAADLAAIRRFSAVARLVVAAWRAGGRAGMTTGEGNR